MNSLGVSPYVNWLYSALADGLIIFPVQIQHIRGHLSLLSIYNAYHTSRHVVNGRKHPITFQKDTCGYALKSINHRYVFLIKSHGMSYGTNVYILNQVHIHYDMIEHLLRV